MTAPSTAAGDPPGPGHADPVIRPRRATDLTRLVAVLAEQQPNSRYPFAWPLPFPVEGFIARDHELAAWVAELAGLVVGHVSVQSVSGATGQHGVDGPELREAWTGAHGRPADELAIVTALFTSTAVRGGGLGGRLLDTAVTWIRDRDLGACLDVLPTHSKALSFYRSRGWVPVAQVRPPWLTDDVDDVIAMVLPH